MKFAILANVRQYIDHADAKNIHEQEQLCEDAETLCLGTQAGLYDEVGNDNQYDEAATEPEALA